MNRSAFVYCRSQRVQLAGGLQCPLSMENLARLQSFKSEPSVRSCNHCGVTFQSGSESEQFCCRGCETVYALLTDEGLAKYYELREESPPACPVPARVSKESFDFCDDPEILRQFALSENKLEFFVEGLNCSACLWLLEKLPDLCGDIAHVAVNFSKSTVTITRAPEGSFSKAAQALNRIGFYPRLVRDAKGAEDLRRREFRISLVRIGIAAACTGNIMIFAVSLYGGATGDLAQQFAWLTCLLSAPVLTYCAYPFYKSSWSSLRSASINLDVPIVAALLAGMIMSFWSLLAGGGAVYFDSLSMLVFLLLSSRTWLKNLQQKYLDSSHLDESFLIGTVQRVCTDGSYEQVSALSLNTGDLVEIKGEMTIPADGKVRDGSSTLQAAALTGESNSVEVSIGETVYAGTQNLSGSILIEVLKSARDSRFASILREADLSAKSKPKLTRLADKVGRWFIVIVFLTAATVCAVLASSGHAVEGFSRALALVIVTCPCVFGMAIPLSLSLAVKAAAARGIVIKDGEVIERLRSIKTLYFDKTGTLTDGKLSLRDLECVDENVTELEELGVVKALESNQEHPVARALLSALSDFSFSARRATNIMSRPAGGIEGLVNGKQYSIRPLGIRTLESKSKEEIHSAFGLYREDTLLFRFTFSERVSPETVSLLANLRRDGFELKMLSGDRQSIVREVGSQLGFQESDLIWEATPERKHSILKNTDMPAIMVGDGANDAPALTAATLGVAVRGSLDVSLQSADVYLLHTDLRALPDLFMIGRTTYSAITRNLTFSVSFNLIAGALAVTGHMEPLWAAVFMPLSSLTVLISALLTGKYQARSSS